MPQTSIGQIGTCGMCKFNNIQYRSSDGWEVHDFGYCTVHNKDIFYHQKCQFYEMIDAIKPADIIKRITDFHTHFGPYGNKHFSVDYILSTMKKIGIKRFATMPAPMMEDAYIPDNHSVLEFFKQDEIEVIPILLTSPLMIEEDPEFKKVADIPYKIIKIHPYAHSWNKYPELVTFILNHARQKQIPVMIHTGYDESQPNNFIQWFENYPDINFILAHGKPAEQAIPLMQKYKNVWIDISFMDLTVLYENIATIDDSRVLFGTDMPINEFFYTQTSVEYCNDRIKNIIDNVGGTKLFKWGNTNPKQLKL